MFTIIFHPSGNRVLRFVGGDVALLFRMVRLTSEFEGEGGWRRYESHLGPVYLANPKDPLCGDRVFKEDPEGEERTFQMGPAKYTTRVKWVGGNVADQDLSDSSDFGDKRCVVAAIGHAVTEEGAIVRPVWVTGGPAIINPERVFDSARGIAQSLGHPMSVVAYMTVGENLVQATTRTFSPADWDREKIEAYQISPEQIGLRPLREIGGIEYEQAVPPLGGLAWSCSALDALFRSDRNKIENEKKDKPNFEGDVLGGSNES